MLLLITQRLPFTDATSQQRCPIASSSSGAVVVLFQSRDSPFSTVLPVAETAPPATPSTPTAPVAIESTAAKLAAMKMSDKVFVVVLCVGTIFFCHVQFWVL